MPLLKSLGNYLVEFLRRLRCKRANRSRRVFTRRESFGNFLRYASSISSIGSSPLASSICFSLRCWRIAHAKYKNSAPGIRMAAIMASACSTEWVMASHSTPCYRSDSLFMIGVMMVSHAICRTPTVAAIHSVAKPASPTISSP